MTTKNPCFIAVATKDYYFSVEIETIENFVIFKFPDGRKITIKANEYGGLPHKLSLSKPENQ